MANRRCPAPSNADIAFVFPIPGRSRSTRKPIASHVGYQDMRARSIHCALLLALIAYGAAASAADVRYAPADRTPKGSAAKGKAQKIYASTCRTCHDSGLLGAPRVGNREEWAPRISKGRDVLLDHTINGFQKMPPRGGRPTLTAKDLATVLDYMLTASQ